jgi:limonene-1,2-epoxide hydrolase
MQEVHMSASTELIESFVETWARNDVDAIMEFFTPDCVYHNMPMAPVNGTEAIRQTINGFAGMSEEIQWDLLGIAESEQGSVFTERVDKFKIAGKWVALPVTGVFELTDGKISAWRDYFDMNQFTTQLPSADS